MKVAVCLKLALRPEQALPGGTDGLELAGAVLEWEPGPGDLVACEAAVVLSSPWGGSVDLFTVGPAAAEGALRAGLELGASQAARIDWDPGVLVQDGGLVGRLLAAAIDRAGPFDVVLFGARSSDWGSAVVPAVAAECLGLPLVAGVTRLTAVSEHELEATVSRGAGRRMVVTVRTPVAIGAEPPLAEPRYPSMAARLRARQAHIKVLAPAELLAGPDLPWTAGPASEASGQRAPGLRLARLRQGGPSGRGLVAPPPGISAHERLAFILAGGSRRVARSTRLLEGSSEEVISAIVEFLADKGVV